jgi:hypothetical protein
MLTVKAATEERKGYGGRVLLRLLHAAPGASGTVRTQPRPASRSLDRETEKENPRSWHSLTAAAVVTASRKLTVWRIFERRKKRWRELSWMMDDATAARWAESEGVQIEKVEGSAEERET